ncbi:MAG: sulfite exporter TauE/SafE family protein [Stagnimonas sp.]|nr:sulfite exporter TauE/SafE family protein [Stagnimonas sp.]
MDWLNAVAGFGVGALVGLTGVGGGALMTPILVLLFGVAPATAVGTDLWFAAVTKMVGGSVHGKSGMVDWEVVRRLCCGSLPAAVLTLLWLHFTNTQHSHDGLMLKTLGGVLILTAAAIIFKRRFHAIGQRLRDQAPAEFKRAQPGLTVFAGAVLGFLVTFTSVGAGALGAVMLLYLYPRRMTANRLVGTDIVHAIPLTVLAGAGHLLMGNINFVLLGSLLLGSVPGVILGSMASSRAPEALLRAGIAVALVAVGVKMLS